MTPYIQINPSSHLNVYAAGGLFGQYKLVQKICKMTETLAYGYSSESINEYQHDRV